LERKKIKKLKEILLENKKIKILKEEILKEEILKEEINKINEIK
jgi:hypothetical protein